MHIYDAAAASIDKLKPFYENFACKVVFDVDLDVVRFAVMNVLS